MDICYFSPINWDFLKQRPQHIAEELSKYHTVHYIEPSISFVQTLISGHDQHSPRDFTISDTLQVLKPSGKYRLPKVFDLFDFLELNLTYESKCLEDLLLHADIIWLGSPLYYPLVRKFNKKIIYDKMDDFSELTTRKLMKKLIRRNEMQLLQDDAVITIASSTSLYNQIDKLNKPVALIRNGVDSSFGANNSHHQDSDVSRQLKELKMDGYTLFGYIGTVDFWFDYRSVNEILQHNTNHKVIIIGKNNIAKQEHMNIHYFDPVPKSQLPGIINEFDYCLYPFQKNDLLDSIDPVKIYEYLCLNKKTIAVESMETQRFQHCAYLYRDGKQLDMILNKLGELSVPFTESELSRFIQENSWAKRVSEILNILESDK